MFLLLFYDRYKKVVILILECPVFSDILDKRGQKSRPETSYTLLCTQVNLLCREEQNLFTFYYNFGFHAQIHSS